MSIDLTDPEHSSRWEVRDPAGDPVEGVVAFHVVEGWLEVSAGSVDAPLSASVRVHRDFDVIDLLNGVIAHRIRR